ncbi:hypothetical protein [Mesorhizobium sp. ES1-3]|uniref:hypothetical protein n=1 Tax=Mesorhizobium sp. ES1-3 TaxID=2876628 RepID=UPI001CCE81F5|nr:hypothetical protein [Mesorhizobium sp. ES1-3]MBZ9673354.1 hypothetical protein [Mesorhizobium sp. ES1-3]
MNERLRELAVDGFPGKAADEITDLVYGHDTLSVFAARTLGALSAGRRPIASPLLPPRRNRRVWNKNIALIAFLMKPYAPTGR